MMGKKLISVILAAVMCIMVAVPAMAEAKTYTMIESVSITLQYNPFKAGSTDDDGVVNVILNNSRGLYQVESTAMVVPAKGWTAGERPDMRITLSVCDEETTRFAYSASRPSGVDIDGGEIHNGALTAQSKKVYYDVYLEEVQENSDDQWPDEQPVEGSTGGPATDGAWLKDPATGR